MVVDVDDGADVVPVESAHSGADGEVGTGLDRSVVGMSGGCWVGVAGQLELSFDGVDVVKPLLEGW